MTSSVIYYSTDARKNEIYLLNKPNDSISYKLFFIGFSDGHLLLIQGYSWRKPKLNLKLDSIYTG